MRQPLSAPMIGALCAFGASASFTLNDMSVKSLSGGYPLHEVILIRSLVALAVLLAVIVPLSGGFAQLRTRQPVKHLIRGGFVVFSNICFFVALAAMPIRRRHGDSFFVQPAGHRPVLGALPRRDGRPAARGWRSAPGWPAWW